MFVCGGRFGGPGAGSHSGDSRHKARRQAATRSACTKCLVPYLGTAESSWDLSMHSLAAAAVLLCAHSCTSACINSVPALNDLCLTFKRTPLEPRLVKAPVVLRTVCVIEDSKISATLRGITPAPIPNTTDVHYTGGGTTTALRRFAVSASRSTSMEEPSPRKISSMPV